MPDSRPVSTTERRDRIQLMVVTWARRFEELNRQWDEAAIALAECEPGPDTSHAALEMGVRRTESFARLSDEALAAFDLLTARGIGREEREGLTFGELRDVNVARCNRWHPGGLESWSVADWAVAMAGEAGEVCNAVKKLRRVEDEVANLNDGERHLDTREKALAAIGEELADTLLYLSLLAARIGVDLEEAVIAKFNATSAKYGFPEQLRAAPGGGE